MRARTTTRRWLTLAAAVIVQWFRDFDVIFIVLVEVVFCTTSVPKYKTICQFKLNCHLIFRNRGCISNEPYVRLCADPVLADDRLYSWRQFSTLSEEKKPQYYNSGLCTWTLDFLA